MLSLHDVTSLWANGEYDRALECLRKIQLESPCDAEACFLHGIYAQSVGDREIAREQLIRSIELNPFVAAPYWALAKQDNLFKFASILDSLLHLLAKHDGLSMNRVTALFALARAYHDSKNYSEAAERFTLANDLKLQLRPSDKDALCSLINKNLEFTRFLTQSPLKICSDSAGSGNIFIVGMPRSGSTLLEQLLLRIESVKSVGESDLLQSSLREAPGNTLPQKLSKLGLTYSQKLASRCGFSGAHVVDKSLYNFTALGLLIMAMPEAKILFCVRNSLDNLLSIYQAHFMHGNAYSSSLIDAAEVLKLQANALREYEALFPGRIYIVSYEELVLSPAQATRGIFEYCGLPWSEQVLSKGPPSSVIHTSSLIQARQEIYTSSVGTATHYQAMLEPAWEVLCQ